VIQGVAYCVALCSGVSQCGALWCSLMQCGVVCCTGCCRVLQGVAGCCRVLPSGAVRRSVLQCVAVCCSVLQCVAVWRSVLQHVEGWCSVVRCSGLLPALRRVLQCDPQNRPTLLVNRGPTLPLKRDLWVSAIWSLSPQRFHYYFFLSTVSWQYQKYSSILILVLCLLCVTPLVCSSYSSFAPSSPFFSS